MNEFGTMPLKYRIKSAERFNWANYSVEAGQQYSIHVDQFMNWADASIHQPFKTGSDVILGFKSPPPEAGFVVGFFMGSTRWARRVKRSNWFQLIALTRDCVGSLGPMVPLQPNQPYIPQMSGELGLFVNDVSNDWFYDFYKNNHGWADVIVEKLD